MTLAEKKAALNGLHIVRADKEHIPSEELLLSYVPKTTKHIVSLSGTGILKVGHILTLIGHIGFGKSQVSECVISSHLNPYVDTLGIKVAAEDDRPLLWVDGERTKDDIATGFQRMKNRIRYDDNQDLICGDRFKNVYCFPFITYPSREARIKELERLITELQPYLIILDGAADFVYDVNDAHEVTDFVGLLVALANQYDSAIFTSIHPNPGQTQDSKPRGVLGSELLRTSESVLLLKRAPDDRDTRILTMDFGHGKNRNGADNLESYFKWSAEHKMFMSTDYAPSVRSGKAQAQEAAFMETLSDGQKRYGELTKALVDGGTCKSLATAKRWISTAEANGVIFNQGGYYGLSPF